MASRDATGAPPLRAFLLGPARVFVGNTPIPEQAWPRRAARSLLLLLLVAPGHQLPRERVLDLFWPDASPISADRSLRKTVHTLRRVLQPELRHGRDSAYIVVGAESLALGKPPALWVDVEAFEAAVAAARTGSAEAVRACLRDALALHGGDLLAGDPYAEWIDAPRERIRRIHRHATLDLAQLDLAGGEPLATLPALEALLERDGTDEAALRAIMSALAAANRRNDALRWYARGVEAMRIELGVEPQQETLDLARSVREQAPATPIPAAIAIRPHARVPAAPTPLVGREREVERLQDLLLTPGIRLGTVTGPGGVGKTRLAQEVARLVSDGFTDGVCFVSLAPIRESSQVLPAIAHALGLPEQGSTSVAESLVASLRDREVLLVLDNVEQVIEAAPKIARLLEGCEGLSMLATSREPLRLRAEHEITLHPLAVPRDGQAVRGRELVRYEAVELFLHRAHAVRPGFVLTGENAGTVAAICRHLDGLPLAIELAAAQLRDMPPEALLAGLDNRFGLLAAGYRDLPYRQQSLRDAIGWSYDLLSTRLRAQFRHLAIFAGTFTAEAAAAVLDATGVAAPLDEGSGAAQIDELVARSLVRVATDDEARFAMLESIREFGLHTLSKHEEDAARRAHANWFLALAERAAPVLAASDNVEWLDRLEADLDNVRAALEWALDQQEADTALRLSSALRRFWLSRGLLAEGRAWLERALERGEATPPETRVPAVFAAGELSYFLEDFQRAKAHAETGLALCQSLGDTRGMADALLGLGQIARYTGTLDEAKQHLEAGIELLGPTGDTTALAMLHNALGAVAAEQGDHDASQRLIQKAMLGYRQAGNDRGEAATLALLADIAQRLGDTSRGISLAEDALAIVRRQRDAFATASVLWRLATLHADTGDLGRARDLLRESLTIAWERRLDALAATNIRGLAALAATMGQSERAARLFGAVDAFCHAVGIAPPSSSEDVIPGGETMARVILGERDYVAACTAGNSLSPDQVVAEALGDGDGRSRRGRRVTASSTTNRP